MSTHSISHKKRVIGCFLLILLIIFTIAFGLALYKSIRLRREKEYAEQQIKKEILPPVFCVATTNIVVEKKYTAIINADSDITISAATAGEIKKINVDIGTVVTQGEVLIELDKRYKKIDIKKAKANLLEATIALSNATIDLINNKRLFETKVIGDDTLRKSIVAHRSALANSERAAASLEFAREQLKDCDVIAPCLGKISKRYVDIGERVNMNQPLFDMICDTILRVKFFVEDRNIMKLKLGKPVYFQTDIFPDNVFTATVKYISSNVEPKSRLYSVEAEYDNSNQLLKAGMIAKASVPLESYNNIIFIPENTIQHFGTEDFVTVRQGDTNVETKIITGIEYEGWSEVVSGLKVRDKILLH